MTAPVSKRPVTPSAGTPASTEWSYPSADGMHRCHVVEWTPQGVARGVVQIVHGMADRMGRYDELAGHLTARGYVVFGADLLGHGYTAGPGELGIFAEHDGWAIVSQDVHALRRLGAERYGSDVPFFLLGHSMGSMFVRQHLDDYPGDVSGAILSGTTYMNKPMAAAAVISLEASMRLRGSRGPYAVSRIIDRVGARKLTHKFEPTRTDADWLSRDPDFVDANLADPLCGFPSTLALSRDLMVGCRNVGGPTALRRIRTPLLMLSGSEDPLGGRPAIRRIVHELDRAGHADAVARVYPGGRHEVFGEINREEVFADLGGWLDARTGPA
ncbi:MAG: lysophospholipase [Tomitella sp.]|nr:lysophospholipase [Tomitella sp.]